MRPMAAAAIGALISGVAMYAVGARAQQNPFVEVPALVQTVDGQLVQIPGAKPLGYSNGFVPVGSPYVAQQAPVVRQIRTVPAQRTVYTQTRPVQERVVVREEPRSQRTWGKTALIIGGSAASGAGLGAVIGGKKGALAGAAIGGGAASIYEATRRR